MDQILRNGTFYTEDRSYPTCSAVYIRNGLIVAMGTDEELMQLSEGKDVEIHDLNEKFVLPAFTDSHMHLLEYAQQDSMIHLEDVESFDDVIALCNEKVAWAKENGKWINAVGFNQDHWDTKQIPTRRDLDRISSEVPITIRRSCLHVSVCNTKAMKLMGLDRDAPEGEQENYDRYSDGTLNGVLRETAQTRIFEALPTLEKEEIKELILRGCSKLAEKGIVEVQTDDLHSLPVGQEETIINAYKELAMEGRLPIRVYEQCYLTNENVLGAFLERGHCTGETFGNFCIGPVKIVMDGSLGSHSAYMREPYKNDPMEKGIAYYTEEELYRYMKKAHDAGMQIAVHCIGDGALQDVLKTFACIQWENPRSDCRHGIVHCQIMDNAQLDCFRKLSLLGYVQPIFLRCDMDIVDDCVGTELAKQSYNWRRFLDFGIHLSGGSDCPVEGFDVMRNIQYAVSRENFEKGKKWYPENAVTLEEAINMFTYEGAYASFGENVRGTISIGKEANLVVLDQDIFKTPVEEIHTIQVLKTIYKGNTVFSRG